MPIEEERWLVKDDLLLSLRFSRCLGVAPVRFESTRSGTFVYYSRAHRYYGVFLLIVLNASSVYLLCRGYRQFLETPEEYLFFILYSANEILSALPLMFYAFCCSDRVKILLKCADDIRKIKRNISSNETSPSRFTGRVLAAFALWTPAALHYADVYSVAIHVAGVAKHAMTLAMNLQFLSIARAGNAVLEDINGSLRELLPDIHQERLPVRRKLQISHRLRQLTHGYAAAVGVAGELNDADSVFMFLQLVAFTSQFTTLMYMWFKVSKEYQTDSLEVVVYSYLYRTAWVVYEVINVFLLVEPCHATQQLVTYIEEITQNT